MTGARRERIDLITIQLAVTRLNRLQKGEPVRVTIPGRPDSFGSVDTLVVLEKADR
jgi:hypothetical protein